MALKFGRTSGITSRIDPQGNVRYREEEYEAYQAAVAAEQERRKAYDASKAKFKAESDVYYGKSAVDTKEAARTASMLNASGTNKLKDGQVIEYKGAGEMTQAQSDKMFDEELRKGQIVPFNDKSITDLTRKLYQGHSGSKTDLSKIYFDKGTDFKSYRDMYGDDFNPEIWEKDARAGKDSRYGDYSHPIKKKGYSGHNVRGVTPVDPGDYVPANLGKEIKAKDTDFYNWGDKMPTLKVKLGEGELIKPKKEKEKEELSWGAPSLDKRKKATHMRGTRIYASETTKGGRHKDARLGIHNAAIIKQSDALGPQRIKYNTEKRQSAAYFSGDTALGESITGKNESELRQLKKETRGEAGTMLKAGRLGSAATIGKDLGTIRKAIRYVKKGDISIGSVGEETGVTKEGQGSKLRYFTPEFTQAVQEDGKYTRGEGAMYGYKKYQDQEKDKAYRAQTENATNSNTTWDRIQSPNAAAAANTVPPSYNSQVKEKIKTDNPTATKREIKTLVKDKKTADTNLLKKVNANLIEKGLIKK